MKIRSKLLIPIVLISLLSLGIVGFSSYQIMEKEIDTIYKTQIHSAVNTLHRELELSSSLTELVMNKIDEKNLALARSLAEIIRLNPESALTTSSMSRLAPLLGVDEVHVTDANGVLLWGNVPGFYGFDFGSSDQARPFLDILADNSIEIAQEPQPNGAEGTMFQYIGVSRTDSPGVVQAGIDAEVVTELTEILNVQNKVAITTIGQSGFSAIIENGVYSAHKDASLIGKSVSGEAWFQTLNALDDGFQWITIDENDYLAGFSHAGDSLIIGLIPNVEYRAGLDNIRNQSILLIILSSLLLIVILYLCLHKFVVQPITHISKMMGEVSHGNLKASIQKNYTGEFGDLKNAINTTLTQLDRYIAEISAILSSFSNDDYTASTKEQYAGDYAPIKDGLDKIIARINNVMGDLRNASIEVSAGSSQIAHAAQSLAAGSSEQAATIHDFADTMSEIRLMAEEIKEAASSTLKDNHESGQLMEKSIDSMAQMLLAMQNIDENAKNITKVIKVIDDIAFQTNILALNAAVEAARAGVHGKGFAVVADEVRSLASKSAQAASETTALIERSSQSVTKGNIIVAQVNEGLGAVAVITEKNANSIEKMSTASQRQSASMSEVVSNIEQISSVVQANTATAEETAAASQTMSAQADILNQIVVRFQLAKNADALSAQHLKTRGSQGDISPLPPAPMDTLGKY